MLTRAARAGAVPVAALCAVLLAATASCGSGSPAPSGGVARLAASSGQKAPCRLSLANLPAAAAFPGFTEYWTIPHMSFPGRPRPGGPPPPLQREYTCGVVAGFLTDISLTGRYREENNARARSLGYTIGRWPYTPLSGSIVGQQRHKALEVYVSLFQFTSARAATEYADPPASAPAVTGGLAFLLRPRPLHVLSLPGAVAFTQPLGTSPAQDEIGITVRLPLRNFVLVLGLAGGESFNWTDAAPYWKKSYAMTAPLLGGKGS
jgi:hypothetical protein